SYPVLDRASATEPREAVLLDSIDRFEVRFLPDIEALRISRGVEIDRRFWEENWLADISRPGAVIEPPAAVEVILEIEGWGEVERLYVLPAL
ncbi:type II secretion system protein GspJ, partial [Luminiphilus sp.]|nr:type II secretion system protein GspJ [Luminiphilus sp.]